MKAKMRKRKRRLKSETVIAYLERENKFLRSELAKMTDLCSKLADKNTACAEDTACNPRTIHHAPEIADPQTPAQIRNDSTVRCDPEFTLPRRTSPKQVPPVNTWEPNITLRNSFSALSMENDEGEEQDISEWSNRNVTMRKRTSQAASDTVPVKVCRRPIVTTTESYLRNYIPIIPGRKSYAQTVGSNDILIVGTSLLQRIRKPEFSRCVKGGDAKFKVFPGATASRIHYYLIPELRERSYKKVIIHCGGNDLFGKSGGDIVNEMERIYETCRSYKVECIIFSGIAYRKGSKEMQEKRLFVNSYLKRKCETEWAKNALFLTNDNILLCDLFKDGVHLVESGNIKLANNILYCINYCNYCLL